MIKDLGHVKTPPTESVSSRFSLRKSKKSKPGKKLFSEQDWKIGESDEDFDGHCGLSTTLCDDSFSRTLNAPRSRAPLNLLFARETVPLQTPRVGSCKQCQVSVALYGKIPHCQSLPMPHVPDTSCDRVPALPEYLHYASTDVTIIHNEDEHIYEIIPYQYIPCKPFHKPLTSHQQRSIQTHPNLSISDQEHTEEAHIELSSEQVDMSIESGTLSQKNCIQTEPSCHGRQACIRSTEAIRVLYNDLAAVIEETPVIPGKPHIIHTKTHTVMDVLESRRIGKHI